MRVIGHPRPSRPPSTLAVPDRALPARVADDLEHASELAAGARASSTQRAYETDVRAWMGYAEAAGLEPYPVQPAALAAFLGHLARKGLRLSTVRRRCSAIAQWHRSRGDPSPTDHPKVREVVAGLARKLGSAPQKKESVTGSMLREMVLLADPKTEAGARDRAVLLTGFVTGMRRSELASMEWPHLRPDPRGLLIYIPSSKTDQEGRGRMVAIPRLAGAEICPIVALDAWRSFTTGLGPVFLCSDRTIARIVKRYAKRLGLDADLFAGHSTRRGYMTEGHRQGARLADLMQQSGHVSTEVAQGYVQAFEQLENPATLGVLRSLQGLKPTGRTPNTLAH